MGKIFTSKIWLEDREIEILEKYNFEDEIYENEIDEDKHWTLDDLCLKGFLCLYSINNKKFYIGAGGYTQHFKK